MKLTSQLQLQKIVENSAAAAEDAVGGAIPREFSRTEIVKINNLCFCVSFPISFWNYNHGNNIKKTYHIFLQVGLPRSKPELHF